MEKKTVFLHGSSSALFEQAELVFREPEECLTPTDLRTLQGVIQTQREKLDRLACATFTVVSATISSGEEGVRRWRNCTLLSYPDPRNRLQYLGLMQITVSTDLVESNIPRGPYTHLDGLSGLTAGLSDKSHNWIATVNKSVGELRSLWKDSAVELFTNALLPRACNFAALKQYVAFQQSWEDLASGRGHYLFIAPNGETALVTTPYLSSSHCWVGTPTGWHNFGGGAIPIEKVSKAIHALLSDKVSDVLRAIGAVSPSFRVGNSPDTWTNPKISTAIMHQRLLREPTLG